MVVTLPKKLLVVSFCSIFLLGCSGGDNQPSNDVESNVFLDSDNDGIKDIEDRFPLNSEEWSDFDADGVGDNADIDDDNDGVSDGNDAFPLNSAETLDTDNDGIGNNADLDDDNDGVEDRFDDFPLDSTRSVAANNTPGNSLDSDGDGVPDARDAFPFDSTEYRDTDGDGIGNNADNDDDNDGIHDSIDAFPLNAKESVDSDRDGEGDATDNDDDNDGVYDESDDLPLDSTEHADTDRDGLPNNIDSDDDNDGVDDSLDAFPLDATESEDADADGIGNNADPDNDNDGVLNADDEFPFDPLESLDTDNDGIGNTLDSDDDNDGVDDLIDEFPLIASEHVDTDADGTGDFADTDDDNDGVEDSRDAFPLDPKEYIDTDNDGVGNTADTDDDGDGVRDENDAFPLNPNESQDTDRDGLGNNADDDDDGDGVADSADRFPLDPNEYRDTDNDGIGNNADDDDDGDGVLDINDAFPLDETRSKVSSGNSAGNGSGTIVDDKQDSNINDAAAPSDETLVGTEPAEPNNDVITDSGEGHVDNSVSDDSGETPASSEPTGPSNDVITDSDNDGVEDSLDEFPLDGSEVVDTDHDGLGNNADSDDDNDGLPDDFENMHGLDSLRDDSNEDLDNDGFSNLTEYENGSDPNNSNSFPVHASPVVELGNDISIYNDESLVLDSSVSGDGELHYQWKQVSGSIVGFTDEAAATTSVTYTPSIVTENITIELTVSNSFGAGKDTVNVTIVDRIYEAAKQGNPKLLPQEVGALETRILDTIAQRQTRIASLQDLILGNGNVSYDPTQNSRLLELINSTSALPLVTGSVQGHVLATVSQTTGGQRTAAFGHNVLVAIKNGELTGFEQQMVNTIDWLTAPHRTSQADPVNVSLMLMSNSYMSKSEAWLLSEFSNITVKRCTTASELKSCLSDADLIITGSDNSMTTNAVIEALDAAANKQQSLLYTHNGGWNSTAITNPVLRYFGVKTGEPGSAGNYFSKDLANWPSPVEMRAESGTYNEISALVSRFYNNSFSFSISECVDNDGNCSTVAAYENEFITPTNHIRSLIEGFDKGALDIFSEQDQYGIEKLLILLADKYRETVVFPMSKATTATLPFLRSYFADQLVYTNRQYNPVQPDLGNFSRSDFSHVTPVSHSVNTVSRKYFRAAGVYAIPGQTLTVTRTDSNTAVGVSVFINTQRVGSTQHMNPNNGYNRPKALQSHHVPIAAGETIKLTSPYGGPVQIEFSDNGTAISLAFDNIGLHPYWKPGMSDNSFLHELAADNYDWAEISTEHFEVHSSVSKMLDTISEDSRWDTPSELEYFMTKYHHNYSRVEGGFQGESIDVVSEIHDFAQEKGLSLAVWDKVQHFNADQQTCGYGCSGNPYDAAWSFEVLGHGDLHEVGHTMEDSKFRFDGFDGHATTNFYSYYPKSRGEDEDGVNASCQSLKFSNYYDHLQAGDNMSSLGYTGWNYGATLIIELMMHAEAKGVLNNGWHLIPRLHILSRAFNESDDKDETWEANRSSIGFSSYTRAEARNINNNDWLLVAVSYATNLDYRPFFNMMGIDYSTKAGSQVNQMALPPVERAFFMPATNSDYCRTLNQPKSLY